MTTCTITLLPSDTCSHCTKPRGFKWTEKVIAPGYSAPIRYLGDNTVPSLEAYPPPLPALATGKPDSKAEWGATTIVVRSIPKPRWSHLASSLAGGYVEGGWMDNDTPRLDESWICPLDTHGTQECKCITETVWV